MKWNPYIERNRAIAKVISELQAQSLADFSIQSYPHLQKDFCISFDQKKTHYNWSRNTILEVKENTMTHQEIDLTFRVEKAIGSLPPEEIKKYYKQILETLQMPIKALFERGTGFRDGSSYALWVKGLEITWHDAAILENSQMHTLNNIVAPLCQKAAQLEAISSQEITCHYSKENYIAYSEILEIKGL